MNQRLELFHRLINQRILATKNFKKINIPNKKHHMVTIILR